MTRISLLQPEKETSQLHIKPFVLTYSTPQQQQLEELEAIRRDFVPRHSQDNMIGSDDEDEEFETLDVTEGNAL